MKTPPLQAAFPRAIRHWTKTDPVLARLARSQGPRRLPLPRAGGFASLVISMLHQQVSVAAGRSITRKVQAACGGRITAHALARLGADELRACGVSRQKQGYLQDLARRTLDGDVDFRRFAAMSDQQVIETLTRVKGIGSWTAKMFLLFHLQRPDVVAPEDLGLRIAVARAYKVPPSRAAKIMLQRQPSWSPYGSLASLVLWAHKDGPAPG
jgi:DNA-3-methyladenine glycosylase II